MSQDESGIFYVLENVQQYHGSQRLRINRPRLAKIVNTDVFDATISDVLHGFWHEVKTGDVVTQLIEFDQIAARSYSAFNQSPRSRTVFFQ
jgi:hypothetical protein